MPVSPEEIAVGKCYVTKNGQVRRVLEIKDGKVKYESRGRTDRGGTWGAWTTVGIDAFANEVDREVTCDWDPNYPERAP